MHNFMGVVSGSATKTGCTKGAAVDSRQENLKPDCWCAWSSLTLEDWRFRRDVA